jgi:hypothetical protein
MWLDAYSLIVLAAALIYLLGHSFIDRVFDRKEEIINRMTEKGEV